MAECSSTRRSCWRASPHSRSRSALRPQPCSRAGLTQRGSRIRAALLSSRGGCRARAWCWVCGGPTTSSAGAATGAGTRSRTSPSCRGSRLLRTSIRRRCRSAAAACGAGTSGSSCSPSCSWCSAPSSCAAGSSPPCTRSRSARSGPGSSGFSAFVFSSRSLCLRGGPAACKAVGSSRRRFRARVPWRHAGAPLLRALRWPAVGSVVVVAALLAVGVRSVPALLGVPLAVAVATTVVYEYVRAAGRWRRAGGGWSRAVALATRRRRHYGAYLAHLGLAVVVVGLAASHFWQQEKDVTLQPGQQVSVAGYTLTYTGAAQRELADHSELVAAMKLGDQTLEPARATYAGLGGQSLTHVAISTTPIADVYVVLAGTNGDGSASFRVFVNPLVSWIWAGGAIVILGVLLGNAGARRVVVVPIAARVRSPVGAS